MNKECSIVINFESLVSIISDLCQTSWLSLLLMLWLIMLREASKFWHVSVCVTFALVWNLDSLDWCIDCWSLLFKKQSNIWFWWQRGFVLHVCRWHILDGGLTFFCTWCKFDYDSFKSLNFDGLFFLASLERQ